MHQLLPVPEATSRVVADVSYPASGTHSKRLITCSSQSQQPADTARFLMTTVQPVHQHQGALPRGTIDPVVR